MSRHCYRKGVREYESELSKYRVEAGLSVREFCKIVGVSTTTYINLNDGTLAPIQINGPTPGMPKECVVAMAEVLKVDLPDLFPRYFCGLPKELDSQSIEDAIYSNTQATPEEVIQVKQAATLLNALLYSIPTKLAFVLELRSYDRTLEDIASILKCSREYVRQLETKALNVLKGKIDSRNKEERELIQYLYEALV